MANNSSTGPISEFVDKMSKSWDLTIVYPKLWAVNFQQTQINTSGKLADNIAKVLSAYDDNAYHKFNSYITNSVNIYADLLNSPQNIGISVNNARHFMLATRLTIPAVVLNARSDSTIGDTTGGVIKGRYISNLTTDVGQEQIKITFLDTYRGFSEFIIKPWITALGHRGLKILNDSQLPDLRCNIKAYCFAKSGPTNYQQSTPSTFKELTFYNCFPISCTGKDYNFSPDISGGDIMTDVSFGFDYMSYAMNTTASPANNRSSTTVTTTVSQPTVTPIEVDSGSKG